MSFHRLRSATAVMLLSLACIVSSFLSRTISGGLDPLECCAFHIASAACWVTFAPAVYKRNLKGDNGLRVVATRISSVQRAAYAAGCVVAYPLLPQALATTPFLLTCWYEFSSVHSSNVAVLCCSFFVAVSAAFDGFSKFATPLLATAGSIATHTTLSHRVDTQTHRLSFVVHLAAAVAAFTYAQTFNLQSVLVGGVIGALCTSDRVLSAYTLRNTKANVQQACRVSFAICLVTLPLRFYSSVRREAKVASLAEFFLVVSTFWFQSFASEWHEGHSVVGAKPLGLAVLVLVVVHAAVHSALAL